MATTWEEHGKSMARNVQIIKNRKPFWLKRDLLAHSSYLPWTPSSCVAVAEASHHRLGHREVLSRGKRYMEYSKQLNAFLQEDLPRTHSLLGGPRLDATH